MSVVQVKDPSNRAPPVFVALLSMALFYQPSGGWADPAGSVWEVPSNVDPTTEQFDIGAAGIVKVIFYTAPLCNPCSDVLTWLRDHGIDFEERQLLSAVGAVDTVVRGIRAPTVEIWYDDKSKRRVVGYDEKLLIQLFTGNAGWAQDDFSISDFDLRGTPTN